MELIFRWLRQELPEFRLSSRQFSNLNHFRNMYSQEADRIQNQLARALIRSVRRDGEGKCYLGKFNTDKPGLIEYRSGRVYNFSCDFVIPEFDAVIERKLLKYHTSHGSVKPLKDILKRIEQLHGYSVFWS